MIKQCRIIRQSKYLWKTKLVEKNIIVKGKQLTKMEDF